MSRSAFEDGEEEIPIKRDAPAIAALEAKASSFGVISLEVWRTRRGR